MITSFSTEPLSESAAAAAVGFIPTYHSLTHVIMTEELGGYTDQTFPEMLRGHRVHCPTVDLHKVCFATNR